MQRNMWNPWAGCYPDQHPNDGWTGFRWIQTCYLLLSLQVKRYKYCDYSCMAFPVILDLDQGCFFRLLTPSGICKKIWAILIAFWISGIDFKFSLFYFLPCCTSVYLPKSVTARPSRVKQQIKNKFSKQKFFKQKIKIAVKFVNLKYIELIWKRSLTMMTLK